MANGWLTSASLARCSSSYAARSDFALRFSSPPKGRSRSNMSSRPSPCSADTPTGSPRPSWKVSDLSSSHGGHSPLALVLEKMPSVYVGSEGENYLVDHHEHGTLEDVALSP